MSDKSYRDIVHDELMAFSEYVSDHADEWADVIPGGCSEYRINFVGGNCEKMHKITLEVDKVSRRVFNARLN